MMIKTKEANDVVKTSSELDFANSVILITEFFTFSVIL